MAHRVTPARGPGEAILAVGPRWLALLGATWVGLVVAVWAFAGRADAALAAHPIAFMLLTLPSVAAVLLVDELQRARPVPSTLVALAWAAAAGPAVAASAGGLPMAYVGVALLGGAAAFGLACLAWARERTLAVVAAPLALVLSGFAALAAAQWAFVPLLAGVCGGLGHDVARWAQLRWSAPPSRA